VEGLGEVVERMRADGERCLLQFRMRNLHSQTLALKFELKQDEGQPPLQIQRELAPMASADFTFPYPRLSYALDPQPVPSLDSSRQFVVSRLRLPPAQEKRARTKFWRTQDVYERLSASWKVVDGVAGAKPSQSTETPSRRADVAAAGEIRLRTRRVDVAESSVDVLAGLGLNLTLSAKEEPLPSASNTETFKDGTHTTVHVDSFVHLNATLVNRTSRPLKLLCRFVPQLSNGELPAPGANNPEAILAQQQVMCVRGNMSHVQRVQPWPLPPHAGTGADDGAQTERVGLATCVLTIAAEGEIQFGAIFEEVREEGDSHDDGGSELLRVVAPRPLLLRAVR